RCRGPRTRSRSIRPCTVRALPAPTRAASRSVRRTRRSGRTRPRAPALLVQFRDEWRDVERLVAQTRGDLLARRPRPLCEPLPEDLPRLRAAPPVVAELRDQMRTHVRVTDPRAQTGRGGEPVRRSG